MSFVISDFPFASSVTAARPDWDGNAVSVSPLMPSTWAVWPSPEFKQNQMELEK